MASETINRMLIFAAGAFLGLLGSMLTQASSSAGAASMETVAELEEEVRRLKALLSQEDDLRTQYQEALREK